MNRTAAIAVVLLVACACGDDDEKQDVQMLRHDRGDAAAVVIVDRKPTISVAKADAEVEPNDTVDAATAVGLPGAFKGTMNSSNDVDRYKLTPSETGMLGVRVTGADVDLILKLEDGTGQTVIAVSDRGPAQTEEGFPNFPVKKGKTYILAVSEFVKTKKPRKRKGRVPRAPAAARPAREGESGEYTIAVAMHVPENDRHETEPNDAPAAAKDVLLGDELFAYIGWTGDVDTWKVALSGFNASYGLDLTIQGVDGVTYKLEILDASGKPVMTRTGRKGRPVFLRGVVPNKGESHYVARLSAKRSNPQQPYSVRMASRDIDEGTEIEPNDVSARATNVSVADEEGNQPTEGKLRGFMLGGDVDYYKFKAGKEDVVLDVSVSPPNSADVKLSVRAGGKTETADNGKSGATEELSELSVKAGKSAYIVIKGSFDGDNPEPYELSWSATAGSPVQDPQTPDLDDFDKDFE